MSVVSVMSDGQEISQVGDAIVTVALEVLSASNSSSVSLVTDAVLKTSVPACASGST